MKIYNKVVINIETEETLYEDAFEYNGKVALCFGSSDSGGDTTTTIRYAPYVESHHTTFLDLIATYTTAGVTDSAFDGYTDIVVDIGFFGTGYTIASFPSLYDMFGKFMAGLDVDTLFSQTFEDTVNATAINELVSAEAALLDDDIEANVLPRFKIGMRNANSVMSSSYVIGKAMIEDTRIKQIEKFSAELKYRMIPVAVDRWKTHLEWNKSVVGVYAEVMKLFFSAKMDVTDFNYTMLAKDKLWPFTVLDYERAALGALQGATITDKDVAGGSKAGNAISGTLSGAAMGVIAAPALGLTAGMGALVFGALGLAGGLF